MKLCLITLIVMILSVACQNIEYSKTNEMDATTSKEGTSWKIQFKQQLPLLGHRNWILVVDKAFPAQTATGVEYIYSDEKLLPTLQFILQELDTATHVKPIIFRDREFDFITEDQVPGLTAFRDQAGSLLQNKPTQTLLHESVFKQLDESSKLFKVLVIKTNETIPYSSVFIQLDCRYWDEEKESVLRKNMSEK